jgi:putative endopeptidase
MVPGSMSPLRSHVSFRPMFPLVAVTLAAVASCGSPETPAQAPTTTPAASPGAAVSPKPISASEGTADAVGIDLQGIDRKVKPGDDFFAHANGAWIKATEIPADRSHWGMHGVLAELTSKRTRDLIEEATRSAAAGSEAQKVGDFYATFMDEASIEAKGIAPLKERLAAIASITDGKSLAKALGGSLRADVDMLNSTALHTENLFGLWVAQDLTDPTRYSPFLIQGGLGMPDREYYLAKTPRMVEIRGKYQAYVAALLQLAGVAEPEAKAAKLVDLETKIAQVHVNLLDSQDVIKGNNHWKRSDLKMRAPGLDWDTFLAAARLDKQDDFVVWQPTAVVGVSKLVKSQPVAVWKDLLVAHTIMANAAVLPKAFGDATFDFWGKTLQGTPKQRDRWKRGVAATDEALGEAVGKLYVERYFPASEKERAERMVKNVIAAFGKRIDALEWMAPTTKEQAKAKLAVLKVGVGYPDKWRDYGSLKIVRGDAIGNAERASLFEYERNLKKLGQPVDRGEWVMNPQLVNAVNLPAMNALNFPAASLQPPYFDPNRPEAMDYGAFGATIGHEICHSFDDQGAQFDAKGKLNDWWTKDDYAHFRASSEKLAKQYDAYAPFPDMHLNGQQTSSENIADVAGLAAAFDAYHLSLAGKPAKVVAGLTGDQQFFLSFAQSWRDKSREPALRAQIQTDAHAPAEYRAATVRNLDVWYGAFDVKPGDRLYLAPADRARVY